MDHPTNSAWPPDPNVGKVLAGRYRLLRRLSGGGMGAVYEARHEGLASTVAVKLMHEQLVYRHDAVRRFMNEARAAAQLGHPNIVQCTDVGHLPNGAPFLVMELLRGHDLATELQEHGAMSVERALGIVRQIGAGLEAAHRAGIVHRDLKPHNVFLVDSGAPGDHVKLLDFGIARFSHLTTPTRTGTPLGTPAYMAPEQFRDASNVDARADVYALGVLIYEMLTGRRPFDAESAPELALQIAEGRYPGIGELREEVPTVVRSTVKRAMATDPDGRPDSVAALLQELEGRVTARPGAAGGSVRWWWAAAAVGAVVAATLFALGWPGPTPAPPPEPPPIASPPQAVAPAALAKPTVESSPAQAPPSAQVTDEQPPATAPAAKPSKPPKPAPRPRRRKPRPAVAPKPAAPPVTAPVSGRPRIAEEPDF